MTGTQYSVPDLQPSTEYRVPAIRTFVRSLSLTHFRNYHSSRIEVGEGGSVVLIGPNGAGKTNMLEAISLLTPGRGFRRAALSDMDNSEDHVCWGVAAEVHGPLGDTQIGTGRENPFPPGEGRVRELADDAAEPSLTPTLSQREREKRIVRIDGKNAKAQTDLAKIFAALWLTPQMDNLFIEGGTARRKFLDRLVFSFDDEHASRVNAYETAMRERNRLLSVGHADPLWLTALEQKIAEKNIEIAVARRHAVEGLTAAMQAATHPFPKALMSLTGTVESLLLENSALLAEEAMRGLLAKNRALDAQAGRTLIGIHRTQIAVTHVEKQMAAERCSTGEQKALLVSLILAQASAGATWHGRVPVLLLDEVSTHLDATRRHALYTALAATGAQCWLTGTDEQMFEGFAAQRVQVREGRIEG